MLNMNIDFKVDDFRKYLTEEHIEVIKAGEELNLSTSEFQEITKELLVEINKQVNKKILEIDAQKVQESYQAQQLVETEIVDPEEYLEQDVFDDDDPENAVRFSYFRLTPQQKRDYIKGKTIILSVDEYRDYSDNWKEQEKNNKNRKKYIEVEG